MKTPLGSHCWEKAQVDRPHCHSDQVYICLSSKSMSWAATSLPPSFSPSPLPSSSPFLTFSSLSRPLSISLSPPLTSSKTLKKTRFSLPRILIQSSNSGWTGSLCHHLPPKLFTSLLEFSFLKQGKEGWMAAMPPAFSELAHLTPVCPQFVAAGF